MHDHHQLVPLRAVPDRQLDLPQGRLSQRRPTEETKQEVTALSRPSLPESLLPPDPLGKPSSLMQTRGHMNLRTSDCQTLFSGGQHHLTSQTEPFHRSSEEEETPWSPRYQPAAGSSGPVTAHISASILTTHDPGSDVHRQDIGDITTHPPISVSQGQSTDPMITNNCLAQGPPRPAPEKSGFSFNFYFLLEQGEGLISFFKNNGGEA